MKHEVKEDTQDPVNFSRCNDNRVDFTVNLRKGIFYTNDSA
ncbi:hypothetical protein [Agarilytica rhodophyticola]|nr:hypothetical protein [Agarilytica rhodophyticola]